MRKKYLSALLFGALLFASAGTFTSCKDYDDDINNLQNQIDANAKGLEELKSLVENGDYVTGVEKSAEGIVVTFKNGGTKTITLEDKVGSVVTVNEDGVLCIDGEPTEIKAAESVTGEKAPVKIDGGFWAVLNENGEYDKTTIPVSGVSLAGDEKTGYTLTIVNADGSSTSVELPSAASSLVEIKLVNEAGADGEAAYTDLSLAYFDPFTFHGIGLTALPADGKWPGTKELPEQNTVCVAQTNEILVQINPVNVDGKDVNFELINSQNIAADLPLTTSDYTGWLTRAANPNGLYQIKMDDIIAANGQEAQNIINSLLFLNVPGANASRYAVAAGKVRSVYNVAYEQGQAPDLDSYSIMDGWDALTTDGTTDEFKLNSATADFTNNVSASKIEANKWYTIAVDEPSALYDMHLSVDSSDKVLYGIQFKEENGVYQFMFTKTPDNITKPGFTIIIETVDKEGGYRKAQAKFALSEIISSAYTYPTQNYTLIDYDKTKPAAEGSYTNSFSVAVDDMFANFSDEDKAMWTSKLKKVTYTLKDAATGADITDNTWLDAAGIRFLNKNKAEIKGAVINAKEIADASAVKDAKFISLYFENDQDLADHLVLNHPYELVVNFWGTGEDASTNYSILNTVNIPFTLNIPSIESVFVKQNGVFVNDVANAYMVPEDMNGGRATYKLRRAFNEFTEKAEGWSFNMYMDDVTPIVGDYTSADLATPLFNLVGYDHEVTIGSDKVDVLDYISIALNNVDKDLTTRLEAGYKQELIVNVTDAKFAGVWTYGTANDTDYSFKIKLMSPLYEGTIVPTGTTVEIPATDLNGHEVSDADIMGYTYNNIAYSIFKYWDGTVGTDWKRPEIKNVQFASNDTNIFTCNVAGADASKDKAGYVVVYPVSLAETTSSSMKITLTDAWGYVKIVDIPVTVTVGK